MADKEATVYIVDVGETTGDSLCGRPESDLEWTMRYVWDKILTTVESGRKTWLVGVVGVRTDSTDNALGADYCNISVLYELGPLLEFAEFKKLQSKIKPSKTNSGDLISAVVVAIDMIEEATGKLKYKREIILVTDGESDIDTDDLDDISARLVQNKIKLTVLGVDFDDADYGYKEYGKSNTKIRTEGALRTFIQSCGDYGVFGTIAEAIEELDIPRVKEMRPYKTYDGLLTLGGSLAQAQGDGDAKSKPMISIRVERFFKTHKAPIPSATSVVMKDKVASVYHQASEDATLGGTEMTESDFAALTTARTYKVADPNVPGGKSDVPFDELERGYEYGRTAVHIAESDWDITRLDHDWDAGRGETKPSLSIVGFVQQAKWEPFLNMGEAGMIVAQKSNEAAALKLSSFIHALHEVDSYAVARFVPKSKARKDPVLLLLAPCIEPEMECLYDIPLPFAEDVRSYAFPPLDKVVTVAGTSTSASAKPHRNLPSKDLMETMGEYVDLMDISKYERDDAGRQSLEYAAVENCFCPTLHRVKQVIRHRAIYPDQPVPPMPPILVKYSEPPSGIFRKTKAGAALDDLIDTAGVKPVPAKQTGKRTRDALKPMSGLDIDKLLRKPENKRAKIDPKNVIPDFKHMVNNAEKESEFQDAADQIAAVVRQLISDSLGDQNYERAIEDMAVFRDQMIRVEMAGVYNTFVRDLRQRLLSGALGGDRREVWHGIKSARLGLVTKMEAEESDVGLDDADQFYKNQ